MAIAAREGELQAGLRLDFEYPVRFTRDVLAPGNGELLGCLRRREPFARHRVFFIMDRPAYALRGAQAQAYLQTHKASLASVAPVLAVSEQALKRPFDAADWLRARMAAAGLGEDGHVVAVGGDALQELAGFAVATLRPAPRLTRVPTTAAGQIVWCGLSEGTLGLYVCGGRCAAFVAAFAVLNDRSWLELSGEEDRGLALAEAARLGLACDPGLFHWMAERACRLRGGDEELACVVRWAGRLALAAPSGFGVWSRAALGAPAALALDCLLSRRLCGLPEDAVRAALELLRACGLKLWDPAFGRPGRVAAALAPSVGLGGLALLGAIGQLRTGISAEKADLERSIGELRRGLKGGVRK